MTIGDATARTLVRCERTVVFFEPPARCELRWWAQESREFLRVARGNSDVFFVPRAEVGASDHRSALAAFLGESSVPDAIVERAASARGWMCNLPLDVCATYEALERRAAQDLSRWHGEAARCALPAAAGANGAVVDVSVVMPVRNGERFLEAAVRSVLEQTSGAFELIVVDDHSTDGTFRRLVAIAGRDSRLRVLAAEGRGISAALNQGASLARTRYLARMDADDEAFAGRLAAQVAYLAQHPDVVVVGTAVMLMSDSGLLMGKAEFPRTHQAILAGIAAETRGLAHPTVVMRRDAFDAVGGYRSVYDGAEDADLWLRMSEHGQLANLGVAHLAYRLHATNAAASSRATKAAVLRRVLADSGQAVSACASGASQGENDAPLGTHDDLLAEWAGIAARAHFPWTERLLASRRELMASRAEHRHRPWSLRALRRRLRAEWNGRVLSGER